MRNTAAPHWTLLVALLAFSVGGSAQGTSDDQEPVASPPFRDDSAFRTLQNLVISADGNWVAVEEHPDQGDGHVRVWSTESDRTFTIEGGRNPRISHDSRWVSALQKPPVDHPRPAKPTNRRAGQTLVLLDLQDGSRWTIDFVLSYDMTYSSTYLLYLQSPETKAGEKGPSKDAATRPATKPATIERQVGTLHQVPLNRDRLVRIDLQQRDSSYSTENVSQFVTHPTNDHFAYVFHDGETGGDTLRIVKWGIRAWHKGGKIEGLCWAGGGSGGDESITLGFLDSTEATDKDGKRRVNSALYTWQPARSSFGKFTRMNSPR